MKKLLFVFAAIFLLVACKDKKMIVMSKGKAEVNTDAKTIKATDGPGHDEQAVTLGGGKTVLSSIRLPVKQPLSCWRTASTL